MEPFFASLFAGLLFGQFFHPMVYLSLVRVEVEVDIEVEAVCTQLEVAVEDTRLHVT
jgi:hypothetical protein